MTPEERAAIAIEDWNAGGGYLKTTLAPAILSVLHSAITDQIRAAVGEEREANQRAVCKQCAKGAPISDADECMTMGHFQHTDTCHPYAWDNKGRVTGHIHCEAAAIRSRGDVSEPRSGEATP